MTGGGLNLSDVQTICQTLSGLLEKGFGPNALHTMLCSSTGTVMVTSAGMPVLGSLHMSHPLGRMVVDSVTKHHALAGDHSKIFVFLLAEIFRLIDNRLHLSTMKGSERQTVERFKLLKGFSELKRHILPKIIIECALNHSQVTCLTEENITGVVQDTCRNLLKTFLGGKLNQQSAAQLSELILGLIFIGTDQYPHNLLSTVQRCIGDVNLLCLEVPGQPIQDSRILDGVLIQRDFRHLDTHLVTATQVKFVLLSFVITGDIEAPAYQPVFQANSKAQLSTSLDWKRRHVEWFLRMLQKEGVVLILSSVKLDDLTVFICRNMGISCVQMIPDEEMERVSLHSQTQAMHSVTDLKEKNTVGTAKSCEPHNVGGHRYVRVCGIQRGGSIHGQVEKQVLVCAPSPGMCNQVKRLVDNALKILRAWLTTAQLLNPQHTEGGRDQADMPEEHNCSAPSDHQHAVCSPGGGAIELAIHHCLKSQASKCHDSNLKVACELLSDAMLTIPTRLLLNSYAPRASRLSTARLLHLSRGSYTQGQPIGVDAKSGQGMLKDCHVVEPLSSKLSLLCGLMDVLQQLLRLDRVVPVAKSVKSVTDGGSDTDSDG